MAERSITGSSSSVGARGGAVDARRYSGPLRVRSLIWLYCVSVMFVEDSWRWRTLLLVVLISGV